MQVLGIYDSTMTLFAAPVGQAYPRDAAHVVGTLGDWDLVLGEEFVFDEDAHYIARIRIAGGGLGTRRTMDVEFQAMRDRGPSGEG